MVISAARRTSMRGGVRIRPTVPTPKEFDPWSSWRSCGRSVARRGYTYVRPERSLEGMRSSNMITLTTSAADKVKELLVQEGRSDIALRVAVQPGGCSGLRYAMYLDDEISEKDVAEEQFGVRVVVDRMSVPYLAQAKIDFVDSLEQSGFTIDNPMAQSSCACGNSFH